MLGDHGGRQWGGRARAFARASLVLFGLFVTSPAISVAQPRVVLSVPEEMPERTISALVVELQLSGHEPLVMRRVEERRDVVSDPFGHSGADRAVVVEASGHVVVADREGPIAEAALDGSLASVHPRALAMIAADLASRDRPPIPAATSTPPASVDLPRLRLADPSDALSPPAVIGPSRELAAPQGPRRGDHTEPAPPADPPRTPWPSWLRILTEVAFGFAGSAVLGVPAALATDAIGGDMPDGYSAGGWLYGYAAAGPIGYALGVWLGGLVAGGDGNAWWTLLGGLVGGLVAGALLLTGRAVDDDPTDGVDPGFTIIGAFALIAAPTTLSVLGFELSSD